MNLGLNELAAKLYKVALTKGYWQSEITVGKYVPGDKVLYSSTSEKIALIHSELSEALEESRKFEDCRYIYFSKDKAGLKKPEGFGVEMADAVLRIMDLCHRRGVNLEKCMEIKIAYNEKRTGLNKNGKRF